MALSFRLEVAVGLLEVRDGLFVRVLASALDSEHLLELLEAGLFVGDLRRQVFKVPLLLHDSLVQRDLLVFKAGNFSLELGLVSLLVVGDALEGVELFVDLLALSLHLAVGVGGFFELAGDVVDVALQGEDLLHVVLLLLLVLRDHERRAAHFLLSVLHLVIEVFVLGADCLDSVLETLNLEAGVAVIGKDVLFLDFEGAGQLLGSSLLVGQFLVLGLEKIVGVRAFAELLVHEPILPRQCLDVLSQLGHLLGLELRDLRLLVDFLGKAGAFRPQSLYFLLSLEKLALVVVFFADGDAHLVLDVAELEALLLQLLPRAHQLFSLLVQLGLHLVQVAVQHGHALLQIAHLLVLGQQLALVALDVVQQHSLLVFAAATCRHGLLQPLEKLVLGVVQVLDQGAHSLNLAVQILSLL